MTILITGISGFTGCNLAKRLNDKEVIGIIRDKRYSNDIKLKGLKSNFIFCSLDDIEKLKRIIVDYNVDIIYHTAAQAIVSKSQKIPISTFESNIIGTYNLLEAVRTTENNIKAFLHVSTDKVYGNSNILPYCEDHALNGYGVYETSKICAEKIAFSYYKNYSIPVVISRSCNIFGEYDFANRIIPNTIKTILLGQRPVIYKNFNPKREYIYINDTCEAYKYLIENINITKGNVYNIGSGYKKNQEELVKDIIRLMNTNLEPIYIEKKSEFIEIDDQYLNSQKINNMGWNAKTSIDDGLKNTIKWWKEIYNNYGGVQYV